MQHGIFPSKGLSPGFTGKFMYGRLDRVGLWLQHLVHIVITWLFHRTKLLRFGKLPLSMQDVSFHALCICSVVHMLTAMKQIFTHYYQTHQEFMNHMLCLGTAKQVKDLSDYLYTFLSSWSWSHPFPAAHLHLPFLHVWVFIAVCLQAAKPVLVWARWSAQAPVLKVIQVPKAPSWLHPTIHTFQMCLQRN